MAGHFKKLLEKFDRAREAHGATYGVHHKKAKKRKKAKASSRDWPKDRAGHKRAGKKGALRRSGWPKGSRSAHRKAALKGIRSKRAKAAARGRGRDASKTKKRGGGKAMTYRQAMAYFK